MALPPSMFEPKAVLKSAPVAAHEPSAPIPVDGVPRDPSIYGFKRVGEPVNYEDVEYIEDTTISSPTLPPVNDPELIQFQKELDRRYFNLNRDVEKEKVGSKNAFWPDPGRIDSS